MCKVVFNRLYISKIVKNKYLKILAYLDIFSYLCTMKKDEIIELLKEQLRVANDTMSSLTCRVSELTVVLAC